MFWLHMRADRQTEPGVRQNMVPERTQAGGSLLGSPVQQEEGLLQRGSAQGQQVADTLEAGPRLHLGLPLAVERALQHHAGNALQGHAFSGFWGGPRAVACKSSSTPYIAAAAELPRLSEDNPWGWGEPSGPVPC